MGTEAERERVTSMTATTRVSYITHIIGAEKQVKIIFNDDSWFLLILLFSLFFFRKWKRAQNQ